MSTTVEKSLGFIFRHLKNAVDSSQTLRNLRYDAQNAEVFSNLFHHEYMVADAVRVNTYREAIQRYVKPGDVVVDLGTGTGILSLLAAAQKPRIIYALDHSNFISIAKRLAEYNGITNIQFVQTNSRSFSLAEKADIMIQEQMSDTLFGENMIENILDLKTRILKPSGRILPGKFEVFFEPVSLKKEYRIPFIWENKIHGLDFGCLRNDHELEQYKPDNYQCRTLPVAAIDYFLCDPVAAFSFDLNEWTPSTKIPQMVEASRKVIRAGSLDGLIFYFRTIFNDEISFDTSPLSRHTSWAHRFFRAKSRDVREGEEVSYTVDLTDILYAKQWKLMFK